jgi:hypothetical protein
MDKKRLSLFIVEYSDSGVIALQKYLCIKLRISAESHL